MKRKKKPKLVISWDGCGEWIRFWHNGNEYQVPQILIEGIKQSAVEEYKKELQRFIGII